MPAVPPASPRPESLPWWLAPVGGAALVLAAGVVVWAFRDPNPEPPAGPGAVPPASRVPAPVVDRPAGLHSVTAGVENGVRVLKIRVTPGGDELIVDAATGRLLETRPGRPAAGAGA